MLTVTQQPREQLHLSLAGIGGKSVQVTQSAKCEPSRLEATAAPKSRGACARRELK